jgi:general secretion pathway protein D
LLLLSACAQPGRTPIVPAPLVVGSSLGAQAASPVPLTGAETRIERAPRVPDLKASVEGQRRDEVVAKALQGDPVSIDVEQVPLATFAQVVFADVLKRNVSIDPAVVARKDLVTFRSGGAQAPAALDQAARLLLRSYGVSALDVGGLVRVLPDNANPNALPEIRRGAALPDTPMQLRPVFQLVELQSVQQIDVVGALRNMFGERIRVQEDVARNAILLSGAPDNMRAVIEAIRVLDQPSFRGAQSISITPVFWSAEDLARRLQEVLQAEGYAVQPLGQGGGIRFPIVILPVAGVNAVFVFARSEEILQHISEWVRKLDRANERGIGKNYFTYAVKHKDASALANTLEQVLGRSRASVPATAGGTSSATGATSQAPRSGAVVVDPSTNMLIFQTSQDEYSQVMGLLQTLDRPSKTALIEVTVAELSLDENSQLGVEWLANKAISSGGSVTAGTTGGLSIGTSGFNLRVFDTANVLRLTLNALASDNKATVLSSPRIMARNGETATIQVGQEVPIITSQQSTGTTTTTATSVLQTIQYRNTGVILKVKPVIHSGDQIDLDVVQEVSAAQSTNTGVNVSPTFTTRKIDTKLTLRNGNTVLLGGLISDEKSTGSSGIPGLRDLPGIGALFSMQTRGSTRRELVVLITPYIISDEQDAELVTNAFRKMLGPWAGTIQSDLASPGLARPASPAGNGVPVAPAAASAPTAGAPRP